ncbi:MAG: outer membrane beta-barrel protein [Thermoguttaceae bacterium]|nr:outer membrane beta-barrel protein [Thermoguttaceae bacterium]
MKKGFFTFASFMAAVMVWGTIASAADSVLLQPTPMSDRADAQAEQKAAEETTEAAAPQAVVDEPQLYFEEEESQFKFGGFIYSSWYDGFYRMNDPNSMAVNQTCLFAGRELDTSKYGFDWGYYVEFIYGTEHGQCVDDGFDGKWGVSGDGYGASLNQIYTSLGWENLTLKIGKFGTPIGYESPVGIERDLNSTSYMYEREPAHHTGVLAEWQVSDRFALTGGITTGDSNSYDIDDNYGFLFGASYDLTERLSVSYQGMINRVVTEEYPKANQYEHCIIVSWDVSCRLNCAIVTNYGSWYDLEADDLAKDYFGIAEYLTYQLTDKMQAITRVEWVRENLQEGKNDYKEVTFGIKYNVNEHLMLRPEVRYDWVKEEGEKDKGFSGGIGGAFIF